MEQDGTKSSSRLLIVASSLQMVLLFFFLTRFAFHAKTGFKELNIQAKHKQEGRYMTHGEIVQCVEARSRMPSPSNGKKCQILARQYGKAVFAEYFQFINSINRLINGIIR